MTLEQSEARCLELTNTLERLLEFFIPEGGLYTVDIRNYEKDEETYECVENAVVTAELQEAIELAEDVLYRGVAYAEE